MITTTHTDASVRVRLSAHAVQRWCERVDPGASQIEARLALGQLISRGRVRPTPRHWTSASAAPGLTFVYWSQRSDVCALIVDGVVVTVLTRALCRGTALHGTGALGATRTDPMGSPRHMKPVSAWRWDGRLDAA